MRGAVICRGSDAHAARRSSAILRRVDIKELVDSIDCVVFDVGETLVDETRRWTALAEDVGVTPFALMGVLGALIERGEDHRALWSMLGVPAPLAAPAIEMGDLYPDAIECVTTARAAGLLVGIAGNQPAGAHAQLASLGFDPDLVASSALWGVAKPSPAFFARVAQACACPPEVILYVGDRLDNDVLPARAARMRTALIRRGPWGFLHARRAEAELADLRIDDLRELSAALA